MSRYQFILLLNLFYHCQLVIPTEIYKFPDNFLLGVASSAYQIEGGHNANGKGVNIWDDFLVNNPNLVKDQTNGNIACDSYNKLDLEILSDLNVNFYRFSISWSRILPTGYTNRINQDGIDYYNRLINGLLKRNIQPMATMYHWDLPINLQQLGGWTNPRLTLYFQQYADILFRNFGDRVKFWITINTSKWGYGDNECPPQYNQSGIVEYLYAETILLAHSKVYHLYNEKYRQKQNGQIGLTIDGRWYESIDNQTINIEATDRVRQFTTGIYLHPLVHGDYPQLIKTRIKELSHNENFLESRLPELTSDQIRFIHKSYDFIGLNIYTTFLVENSINSNQSLTSFRNDIGAKFSQDINWPKTDSDWLRVVPEGLRKILNWMKIEYGNPTIFITENGVSDAQNSEDFNRINYLKLYLRALLESINIDGVNVKAYAVWSLFDNFEWLSGYTERFGLYFVDFNDTKRSRTAKLSAKWYKQLIKKRELIINDNDNNQRQRLLEEL